MTTRAGTTYRMEEVRLVDDGGRQGDVDQGRRDGTVAGGRDGGTTMVEMMRILVEDRQRHEAELAEERRLWEEERRRREAEFEEERHRQQVESARREEQTFQQMQVLQALVEGVHLQGEAMKKQAGGDREVRVPKLTEQDDIVSYLTMFERLMTAFEVKREKWAFKLASNLSGKAQKAYAALPTAEAGKYEQLKEAILRQYDITDESYRQWFRSGKRGKEESNRELVARLNDLATKWLKSKKSREEVVDQIILEQFLKTLPDDVRVFVRERGPGTSVEAAKLADDYLQARKEDLANKEAGKKGGDKSERRCYRCGKMGHIAKDCYVPLAGQPQNEGKSLDYSARGGRNERSRKDLKDIECYNCHKKGHYSSNCPQKAMLCTEREVNCGVISKMRKLPFATQPGTLKAGVVEGRSVGDILLDTGCSRTLVHRELVPESKLKDGKAVAICCAHGDTVLYPRADIMLEVNDKQISVEAAVSDTLPYSVLLGTDTPELVELLVEERDKKVDEAFAVTTRAQERKEREEARQKHMQEEAGGVQPNRLEDDSSAWMSVMDEELFGKNNGKDARQGGRNVKKDREGHNCRWTLILKVGRKKLWRGILTRVRKV